MIFIFRNTSLIISFVTFFCLSSRHVAAHCFNPDGSIYHHVVECNPTISPAPTESPAPSPSPSAFPTDTQAPSHSMLPSSSPTPAPTTNKPSAAPTESPTESPAPSPSPSAVPSPFPTKSAVPSTSPSDLPSEFPSRTPSFGPTTSSPSDSPTSSPSNSPTSPILLIIENLDLIIEDVTGEREMSPSNVTYFEKEITLYLRDQIQEAQGVSKIEVEEVLLTNQSLILHNNGNNYFNKDPFLRKRRQLDEIQTHLIITFDVVVSVILNQSESLNLSLIFEDFFDSKEHQNELRRMLQQDKSFAKGIFKEEELSSSKVSDLSSNVTISSTNSTVRRASNGTGVTGIVLGVVALIVGSGLLWMWVQARRINFLQPKNSGKIENIGTKSRSFESDDRRATISRASYGGETYDADGKELESNRDDQSYLSERSKNENERYDQNYASTTHPMYVTTFMNTESNIEVPDTPVTAFAINGFATPASANGFMTPASVKSKVFEENSILVLPKSLAETPSNRSISSAKMKGMISSKSRKQKIPLPPKILGPLKSPFRRKIKASNKIEKKDEIEYDEYSMSREGVVAGVNNVRPIEEISKKKAKVEVKHYRTKRGSWDLPPSEIGGPSVKPYQAELTVVPVEEDFVVRTKSSRQNTKRRPCPPPLVGGPSDTWSRVFKSTNANDRGGVDIVDEIAYLYSTNSEPERYAYTNH